MQKRQLMPAGSNIYLAGFVLVDYRIELILSPQERSEL